MFDMMRGDSMKGFIRINKIRDGEIIESFEFKNMVVLEAYTNVLNNTISSLNLHIGYSDSIATDDFQLGYSDISPYFIASKSLSAVQKSFTEYEYQALYPDNSFAPPSEDRTINIIALVYSTTRLIAYKKLTEPIIQTPSDYLEIIYRLSTS